MPLGYGSQYVGVTLTQEEIGTELYTQQSSGFGFTGFLRILLTIAEIGFAFIPGLNVVAETGIGLAAGIGNEALDISEGNANVASSILNLGSPFIGGAFAGIRNVGQVEKLATIATETDVIPAVEGAILNPENINIFGNANEQLKYAANLQSPWNSFNSGVRGVQQGELKSLETLDLIDGGISNSHLDLIENIKQGINSFDLGEASVKVADNIVREGVDDDRFGNFLAKTGMSDSLIEELRSTLKYARTLDEQRTILLAFIRELGAKDSIKFFRNVTGEIEQVFLNEAWQLPLARRFAQEYDGIVDGMLSIRANKAIVKEGRMTRIVKYLSSTRFNDRIVQRAQAIFDPNDLGRAGVETLYRQLKKYIGTYFKRAEKLIEGADKIEDAFVASGGKLVDSEWHMGYKVVKDLGLGAQLVMIQFKAETTNGKRPVIVIATDAELERYILNPGRTYLRLWSYSRGGKSLGLGKLFGASSIFKLGRQGASVLGFLPVQALRNILSLVSNVVENTADVANGTYFKTYQKKFVSSLTRSAISRSFRIAGRVVIGGAAGVRFGKSIGNFIGKEAQRIGTNVFAKGIQNVIAGKAFSNGLQQRVVTGTLVSIRGNMLRNLRHYNPNSVIVNSLSARRKLYQIKRIPNAFVPGRPWKGIKL